MGVKIQKGKPTIKGKYDSDRPLKPKRSEGVVQPELVNPHPRGLTKFSRIANLPDEQREILHGMYAENRPISYMIEVLTNMGLFTDVRPSSLKQYLYRYKWEVIDKQILVRADLIDPKVKARLATEVTADLDVLSEISELVISQKSRVSKMLNREKDMPMLFNSLGGEIRTLANLLGQHADLSFELGLLRRVPKVTKVTNYADATVIESTGKEAVTSDLALGNTLRDAADAFFQSLTIDGESTDVSDE